jgi:hypothetical protein
MPLVLRIRDPVLFDPDSGIRIQKPIWKKIYISFSCGSGFRILSTLDPNGKKLDPRSGMKIPELFLYLISLFYGDLDPGSVILSTPDSKIWGKTLIPDPG